MFEPLIIQSHTGPYEARFSDDALVPAGVHDHFIIDRRVADLHGPLLAAALARPSTLLFDALEENKSLEALPAVVGHLVAHGIRRDHRLVAIGGGITQDITCFVAATLLRGVEWRFFPTTLLAQADSCIGSKSSINCGQVKNVLGTFTPPRTVEVRAAFLDTLPAEHIRSGIGEMLKVHAIDGPDAFDAIAAAYPALLTDRAVLLRFVRRSLEIKKRFIELDEFDTGPRNIFNYGHSFGHAIEAATRFAVPHGIAVTIGMDMANWIAARLGLGTEEHFRRMHPVLARNFHGCHEIPVPLDPFLAAIGKDKKNVGDRLSLILPDRAGAIGKHSCANDGAFRALSREYLEEVRRT